ncbi:MAG: hypothetical protein OEM32_05620, partial [Acidimicrobiia bacterium]|nr:hypothetical protein [Acidimicrobiia bacterium]
MAIDVVAARRLPPGQAVAGVGRFPPAADEVARWALVDTPMDRAAESCVPVVATGGGTTYCCVGSGGSKDEVERS